MELMKEGSGKDFATPNRNETLECVTIIANTGIGFDQDIVFIGVVAVVDVDVVVVGIQTIPS
jgi:hypothetical protein